MADKPSELFAQIDLLSLKPASYLSSTNAGQYEDPKLASTMTNNLQAYRYYSLGVEQASGYYNAKAIALFQKAVALDSQFAMAYARIGYTYAVNWNRESEGKPYLEKAFQLSGRLTERDRLYITAWYAIANYDYAGALTSFQEVLHNYPVEVEAYRRLGALLDGEERYQEAIDVMKQGLMVDPAVKDLYNSMGLIYSELGRHDEAISMFKHYVELGPQEPNSHDSLAGGYQWAGRYAEALDEYQRALALNPDFDIAVIHLGNCFFQLGRYRDALTQYQRYIRMVKSDWERARGDHYIAYVDMRLGRFSEVTQRAAHALKYDSTAASAFCLWHFNNQIWQRLRSTRT